MEAHVEARSEPVLVFGFKTAVIMYNMRRLSQSLPFATAIALAATTPPPERFEGHTHTEIACVNAIEGVLAQQMAQTQAATSTSVVQLTSSAEALVRHAGIHGTLQPSEPAAGPARTYAAIAGAPVPAAGAVAAADADRSTAGSDRRRKYRNS